MPTKNKNPAKYANNRAAYPEPRPLNDDVQASLAAQRFVRLFCGLFIEALATLKDCVWEMIAENRDSPLYGRKHMGNGPGIMATDHMAHGPPHSIEVTLPPLAVVVLKPRR